LVVSADHCHLRRAILRDPRRWGWPDRITAEVI
jgi:hypothetical protein